MLIISERDARELLRSNKISQGSKAKLICGLTFELARERARAKNLDIFDPSEFRVSKKQGIAQEG